MINALIDGYVAILKVVLTLLMIALLVLVGMQVGTRYFAFVPKIVWTEEAARLCFVWIVMLGAIVAVRERTHFVVDLFGALPSRTEFGMRLLVGSLSLLLAAVFAIYGYVFAKFGARQVASMTGVSMLAVHIAWPLLGVSWIVLLLHGMVADIQAFRRNKL